MPNIENDSEHLSFVKLKWDNYIESGKRDYQIVQGDNKFFLMIQLLFQRKSYARIAALNNKINYTLNKYAKM